MKFLNIKLTEDGIVKLLDMNAAKYCDCLAAKDTVLLGTQGYAAPEQYGFGASNVQTDIYAVGVLMNVLLTGKLPAEQKASGKLRGIIAKCTKLAPEQRYSSIDSLLAALSALKPDSTSDTPNESGWRRFLPPGFRSGNLLLSALSFVGYSLLKAFSNRDLLCKIFAAKVFDLMGWNPQYRYKMMGKPAVCDSEMLYLFKLTDFELFVNGKKSKSYLPEDWRNYFGTPVEEHEDSYKINLADGYITTQKT